MATATKKKATKKKATKKAPKKTAAKKKASKPRGIASIESTGLDTSGLTTTERKQLDKAKELVHSSLVQTVESMAQAGHGCDIANQICTGKAATEDGTPAPDFRAWCREVGISKSTAYRWIALYKAVQKHPILAKTASPKAITLLAAEDVPEKARAAAAKHAEAGDKIDERLARELIDKALGKEPEVVPAAPLEDLSNILQMPVVDGSAAETEAEGSDTPPANPPLVVNEAGDCPYGGDHQWESDGEGGQFCANCQTPYKRKEHGAKLAPADRSKLHSYFSKLVKMAAELGVLDRFRAQANELEGILRRL